MRYLSLFVSYYIVFFYVPLFVVTLIAFCKRNFMGGVDFTLTFRNFLEYDYANFISIFVKTTLLNLSVIIPLTVLGFVFAYFIKTIRREKVQMAIIIAFSGLFATEGLVKVFAYNSYFGPLFQNWISSSYIFQSLISLLPISILLIYFAIYSVSDTILMASRDLGCSDFQIAKSIVLPMIKKNIFFTQLFCYLLLCFNFLYPQMFMRGKAFLFGNYMKFLFIDTMNWPGAVITSLLSLFGIMLVLLVLNLLTTNVIKKLS